MKVLRERERERAFERVSLAFLDAAFSKRIPRYDLTIHKISRNAFRDLFKFQLFAIVFYNIPYPVVFKYSRESRHFQYRRDRARTENSIKYSIRKEREKGGGGGGGERECTMATESIGTRLYL